MGPPCYIVQTGPEQLGSSNSPASASHIAGATGTYRCAQLGISFCMAFLMVALNIMLYTQHSVYWCQHFISLSEV
jgi:hypothetical protein